MRRRDLRGALFVGFGLVRPGAGLAHTLRFFFLLFFLLSGGVGGSGSCVFWAAIDCCFSLARRRRAFPLFPVACWNVTLGSGGAGSAIWICAGSGGEGVSVLASPPPPLEVLYPPLLGAPLEVRRLPVAVLFYRQKCPRGFLAHRGWWCRSVQGVVLVMDFAALG